MRRTNDVDEQRRRFLAETGLLLQATLAGGALQSVLTRGASAAESPGYGEPQPVKDETTGLPLMKLPDGFRYLTYGWTRDPLADGTPTPPMHDGMAVVLQHGSELTLVRNHEVDGNGAAPGNDPKLTYDAKSPAGCTNLSFDLKSGKFTRSWLSLAGTLRNCGGGPTPWNSWLSCEESVFGPGDIAEDAKGKKRPLAYTQEHGWVFEVPSDGKGRPAPIRDMGRFYHEAVAVDPATGIVYETEDRGTSGLYRYVPKFAGKLASGGKLQMLKTAGQADLRKESQTGKTFDVDWVDIERPHVAHSPDTNDTLGVFRQGKANGGATFARLEGCWHHEQKIYFVSTSGGPTENGQVWEYSPQQETLKLLYVAPRPEVMKMPDNLTVSPRGGLVLCEDSDNGPQRLWGLTPMGQTFTFAVNNIRLSGERNGFKGDFTKSEWCGACFSPDGQWLYVNAQNPGITFAITGPWDRGVL